MMLPGCIDSYEYAHTFKTFCQQDGVYVILDNGMFESGTPAPTEYTWRLANEYAVDEYVMPDVRDDPEGTLMLQKEFYREYVSPRNYSLPFAVMGVVQGDFGYIQRLVSITPPEVKLVLGFPRRLTERTPMTRIKLMEEVVSVYGKKFPMHMLGMSREWPGEVIRAQRQFGPYLRGMDTSAPFVYAYNDQYIVPGSPYVDRVDDYFVLPWSKFDQHIVRENVATLERWCGGLTS